MAGRGGEAGSVLTAAEERLVVGLHRRAVREERGMFLAEGVRVVEELARSNLHVELVVLGATAADSERERALADRLAARCPVRHVTDAEVRRLAGTDSPQGVLAVAHTPQIPLESISPAPALALGLDGVQDPGNFGTLVRTAWAFGADLVLAMTGTVDPWNPKAVRAGAGAAFHLKIVVAPTATVLTWLRSEGFAIFAADARGSSVSELPHRERVALIVGNEGAGVSRVVHSTADERVAVPIRASAESLNVAVAAGILLYVLTREDRQ